MQLPIFNCLFYEMLGFLHGFFLIFSRHVDANVYHNIFL